MRLQRDLDYLLIAGTLILVLFGIIMIYSSTHNFAYNPDFGTYYLRQFMWAIFGLILMFVIANIDYQILIEVSHIFYILTLVLLIATFLFGGRIAGAQRWFRLGPISIQSSEIAKISIILMLVRFLLIRKAKIGIVSGLFLLLL